MRLLLDTHVLLWWLRDDRRLSARFASAIADPSNEVSVSAASVWEASIKAALGKLTIDGDLVDEIGANGFAELAITARHAQLAAALPRHHDDPFDRLLAAQAKLEGLQLATLDPAFADYGVALLA
ncbi:MAG: type II toxin-antitoxin system VapC family toxin [Candidatus Binatia bacterium]